MLQLIVLAAILGIGTAQTISFEQNVVYWGANDEVFARHETEGCRDEEIVRLSGLGLRKVSDELVKSVNIKSILLDNNELTKISWDMFAEAPNLECINLANNRIQVDWVEHGHPNVKELILDYQRESESSDMVSQDCLSLGIFPRLTRLSLKGIYRSCLEITMDKLPMLSSINLSDNKLNTINLTENVSGDEIVLRTVYLERNNIEQFELDHLGDIEALYLDDNPLVSVKINPLNRKLTRLSLAGCSMDLLDDQLYAPYVSTLDLSRNKIRELPENAFRYTPYLDNLNLSGNKFEACPVFGPNINLRSLLLDFNRIDRITSPIMLPTSLTALSLRGNGISVVDGGTFSRLTRLEELDLSQNQLGTLPFDWHFGMPTLHRLNLEGNQFRTMSDMNVYNVRNLTTLRVKGNYVQEMDVETLNLFPKWCTIHVS